MLGGIDYKALASLVRRALSTVGVTLANPAYLTQALADAATISWDANSGAVATVTLGGNRTMAAPENVKVGGLYTLKITQDGTGSRTLTWHANYLGKNNGMPQPTPAASAVTYYTFTSFDGTTLQLVACTKAATVHLLTSGTAATFSTPAGATELDVEGQGNGGGGGAQDTNGGGTGGASTFSDGTLTLTVNGGTGGAAAGGSSGAGGTATGGDINITGANGAFKDANGGASVPGGSGADSLLGCGGVSRAANAAGVTATGYGAGGGGAGGPSSVAVGTGAGAGGYLRKLITAPAASYTYTIGALANGGAAGTLAGGNGAPAIFIVIARYN